MYFVPCSASRYCCISAGSVAVARIGRQYEIVNVLLQVIGADANSGSGGQEQYW